MSKVAVFAIVMGAVAASVPVWGDAAARGKSGAFARAGAPVLREEGDEGAADEPKPEEPARDKKKKSFDEDDVRSVTGGLDIIRDMGKLKRPVPPGLWQKYVNQPYYTPEQKAERLLFHGMYEDAEQAYADLLKGSGLKEEERNAYEVGRLAAILNQGRERDIERFNKGYEKLPEAVRGSPRVVSLRARALIMDGKAAEAQGVLKAFYTSLATMKGATGDALHAVNQYAQALERQANYPAAKAAYAKVAELERDELPADAAVQTEVIYAVYRGGVLSADKQKKRYALARLAKIFELDSTYWPAYLLSGQILLESHNDQEGGARVGDAVSRNPNSLDALYLQFEHAVESYNFEGAERVLDDIKDRSDAPRVLASEGRLLLKKRTPEKALAPLLAAVKKDGAYPEARGWLAATYFLLSEPAKAQEQLDAITVEGGPHPVAVFEAGEVLRDARQFPRAEGLYRQAAKAAAWWSEPSAALAQLYLETGDEAAAREEYAKSFAIDPTNVRAVNQLRLLEEFMAKFVTLRSESYVDAEHKMPRFIIKCSPEDEILAKLAMEWMEAVYPEVTGYFQHAPAVPTVIEFFPNHDQFGVRTTGLPWIGTVGACTGHVIAMDVPRGQAKNMMGTFDWARVLRHEFTHTVTLSMTNNRIPHWLTEAAACEQEQAPRDWENCQLLASNYRAGTLFTLDTLTWGFIKPKRSIDRQLAYMQSQWVYQFLVAAHGQPKMLEFLRAFGEGKTEAQAYKAVYGKTSEELTKEFMAWAGKEIQAWGLPAEPLAKRDELEKKLKETPDDVKALYDYAWLLVNGPHGQEQARTYLEKAQKIDPSNTRVRELLGAILNGMGRKEEAREMLAKVVEEDPKRVVAVRTLGLIAMSPKAGLKDYDAAEKWFLKLQELRPVEETSYTKLAGIYLLRKQPAKAAGQLAKMQEHEQHDEVVPRQLAILYAQLGQLSEAEASAFRAVRINPYNPVNHYQYALALMAQREKATSEQQRREFARRAAESWRRATELNPNLAAFWAGLADACGAYGDLAGASDAAKKAVAIQPRSGASKWIRE